MGAEENIIGYFKDSTEFVATKITNLLNSTINTLVDDDNIFYQIITINYIHYLVLSTLILTGKQGALVNNTEQLKDKLDIYLNNVDEETELDNSTIIDLSKKINKKEMNLYDFINALYSYIYKYVDEFSSKTAPLAVVNESMKIFHSVKHKGVVENKYIKIK